jgi:crossover junction endodeoxyribonuclease RuvC
MIVLGIDPGTRNLGWGVVEVATPRAKHIDHGVLRVAEDLPLSTRLLLLDEALGELIRRFRPQAASVETLFFHKDAQAAAKLGHARGVVLLALARESVPLAEYAPAQVKLTVSGQGRAGKDQVAKMIQLMLRLDKPPPHDAADALALALTHVRRGPIDAQLGPKTSRRRPPIPPWLRAARDAARAAR